jgi:mannose-1-phosphate guanylyltransferase
MPSTQYQPKKPMKLAIFVGGSGTRLWPMSRKALPKQFQQVVGDKTMFQQMIDHLLSGFSADDLFISTSKNYVDLVLEQAPMLNPQHIITEPELRDTAAAVGYAAVQIAHRFPGALMATIWGGDHLVQHREAFINSLRLAQHLAESEKIPVQVCVRPTFPSTALGYIEIGKPIFQEYDQGIYSFVRQVEKPDVKTARQFLASVNYLWHPGYRIWDTTTLLALYRQHIPESFEALMTIKEALDTPHETSVIEKEYGKIVKKSIDYAIYVHVSADRQAVIAADLGWNDIGTWEVLYNELSKHAGDNVTQGDQVLVDTTDSLVYSSKGKMVAVLGMHDVVIVDTPDALVVMPRDRAPEIKLIVEKLKEAGLDQYL